MDRDELQDRIRQRRSGGDPYRRGALPDDGYTGYERFEPEPEDAQARRARRAADERRQDSFHDRTPEPMAIPLPPSAPEPASRSIVPRPDVTREADEWSDRPADAVGATAPLAPPPSDVPADLPADVPYGAPADDSPYIDNLDEPYDPDAYPYAYEDWDDGRRQGSSGAGAFAILGFLALGVLALLGGAVLAGVFTGDPNTGVTDPTLTPSPTLSESLAPTPPASVAPSVAASAAPSVSPAESGAPVVFPDGFTAETQPCIPGSASLNGCNSNAASNNGNVWVWVGFARGTQNDVMSATLLDEAGTVIANGSLGLEDINCGRVCNGWTYFPFGNLEPGTFDVRVERNGQLAAETEFAVD